MASAAPLHLLKAVPGLPAPELSLPPLEPAKSREQYRERPETETEDAIWYSAEEPDTFVEPQQVRLRSIHSKQPTVISFTNKSGYHVRALWVDFKGNEVAYSILAPGSTKRYHTYATHPWIVRELNSATRMMLSGQPTVVGLSTEQKVEVHAPPTLDWNLSTHCCFPESYKASVRGLLLAHKALEPYATATHGPAGLQALAARDVLQSPRKRTAFAPDRPPSAAAFDRGCFSPRAQQVCPVSPRASLLSHNMAAEPAGHSSALPPLSPAGPKGYASMAAPFAATPRSKAVQQLAVDDNDEFTTTTTSISISSEAAHFTATLTVSSPRRANMKSTVNIQLGSAGMHNMTSVNFDTVMAESSEQKDVATAGGIDQLLPRSAASCAAATGGQAPAQNKKAGRGLFSILKACTHPATASPRNVLKTLLHRPAASAASVTSSKPVSVNSPISGPCLPTLPANASLALDVKLRPVHTSLKVEVQQQCDGMFVDADNSSSSGPAAPVCCWPPTDTHLGNLPSHLLVYIAELAAPVTWQSLSAPSLGRPDIKPTLMACPPITAEEQQQMDEQEQQQQQQQQQQQAAQQHL